MEGPPSTNSKGKEELETFEDRIQNHITLPPSPPNEDSERETIAGPIIHHGFFCDGPSCTNRSDQQPIEGARYQCTTCVNADFCLDCVPDEANPHNKAHPFIKHASVVASVPNTALSKRAPEKQRLDHTTSNSPWYNGLQGMLVCLPDIKRGHRCHESIKLRKMESTKHTACLFFCSQVQDYPDMVIVESTCLFLRQQMRSLKNILDLSTVQLQPSNLIKICL